MRRGSLTLAVAAVLASACSGSGDPVTTDGGFRLSINPTSFALVAGDSSTVTVNSTIEGTVRWATSNASVVTVDSVVALGDPARVRAKGTGTAQLNATISVQGQTLTTSVPVRVGGG